MLYNNAGFGLVQQGNGTQTSASGAATPTTITLQVKETSDLGCTYSLPVLQLNPKVRLIFRHFGVEIFQAKIGPFYSVDINLTFENDPCDNGE